MWLNLKELWYWIIIVSVLIAAGIIALGVTAEPAEPVQVPKDAVLLDASLLPCNGVVMYYDTDGSPKNGAEYLVIAMTEESPPLAILVAGPGDDGKFIAAVVRLPNTPEEVFATEEAFTHAYPHPCRLILKAREKAGLKT